MADITMCVATNCPLRENCYRYLAPTNPWRQSYADFTHLLKDGKCEQQIELVDTAPANDPDANPDR